MNVVGYAVKERERERRNVSIASPPSSIPTPTALLEQDPIAILFSCCSTQLSEWLSTSLYPFNSGMLCLGILCKLAITMAGEEGATLNYPLPHLPSSAPSQIK